jgi:hypothetical protein
MTETHPIEKGLFLPMIDEKTAAVGAPPPSAVGLRLAALVPGGLRFLRSTTNRARDHKPLMRTPDLKDRLRAASAAKKAQLERARAIAEDPERLKRVEARSAIIAARNTRIAERERNKRETMAREATERAAAEAAEAAALEAARKVEEEEERAARLAEQARLDAAAAAEREAILALRRAGRKARKRRR